MINENLKKLINEYIEEYYIDERKFKSSIDMYNLERPVCSDEIGYFGSNRLDDWLINKKNYTFQQLIFKIIDENNLVDSDVYKKAQIDKRLFSKMRSDINYSPSKNTAILLILALELDIDKALDILASAGYTLSYSNKSDLIIRYFIENNNYDIMQINEMLYEYDLKTLF